VRDPRSSSYLATFAAAARLLRDSQPGWLTQRLAELDSGDIPALLAAGQDLNLTGSLRWCLLILRGRAG
jgi:hypothetical protein